MHERGVSVHLGLLNCRKCLEFFLDCFFSCVDVLGPDPILVLMREYVTDDLFAFRRVEPSVWFVQIVSCASSHYWASK